MKKSKISKRIRIVKIYRFVLGCLNNHFIVRFLTKYSVHSDSCTNTKTGRNGFFALNNPKTPTVPPTQDKYET